MNVRPPRLDIIPDPLGATSAELPRLPPVGARLATAAPDRAEMRRRRRAALVLSVAWLTGHLSVFGVRHDFRELPVAYLAVQLGAPLVLAVASLIIATRPGRSGLGTRRLWVLLFAVGGPLSFGVLGLALAPPRAPSGDPHPWLAALLCSDIMLAWMSAPLFAAAFALRSAFAAAPVGRSALVGASVGLFSGVTINLHCSNVQPWHLALGHGLPIVLASLFGALVVTRWLRA
jgi:hypothetical protein